MARNKGQVRRSQLITTYGVGSVVAIEDESFMVAGLDRWPVDGPDLHEPRLERMLRVSGFVLPPATEAGNDVPVVRFPKKAYCPSCHLLADHRFFTGTFNNVCSRCGVRLIPSRFVVCCANGHIDDFPYFEWVHAGRTLQKDDKHDLQIESGGNTASLRSIEIKCSCGAERSMEGAFSRNALRGVKRCTRRRPWLGRDDERTCDDTPRTLQRGASNVWFSVTRSAISIPPWSELAFKLLNRHWRTLQHLHDDTALSGVIEGMKLAEGTPYSVQDLVFAVRRRQEASSDDREDSYDAIRSEEYEALCRGFEENSKDQDFVCVQVAGQRPTVSRWFDLVMQVKRLREVRALCTFSRVNPPAGLVNADSPPLYDEDPGWLPGVEVIGEGIFLRLSDALTDWESRPSVLERAARIDDNYRRRCDRYGVPTDRAITPRFIAIHTLAHALIAQWSLDAGYPASSLRERLYVSPDMAGLLIYTATSDSAGSLGGVIAQAEPEALEDALITAIETASWCSSDPLCLEADAAGVDSLNLAACHAGSLLPEVSCEEMNLYLDRAMLVGAPDRPEVGLFREIIDR